MSVSKDAFRTNPGRFLGAPQMPSHQQIPYSVLVLSFFDKDVNVIRMQSGGYKTPFGSLSVCSWLKRETCMPGYAADLIRQRDHGFGVVGYGNEFHVPDWV